MKIIFLDTETTWTDENAKIIQLAYIGEKRIRENSLINPQIEIPYTAMAVHHITNEMVATKSVFNKSHAARRLKKLIWKDYIIVAHNAQFDVRMLKNEWLEVGRYIDTLKIAKYIHSMGIDNFESFNLQYLRYKLWCEFTRKINPHSAIDDVIVLKEVYYKLANYLMSDIEQLLKITQDPILLKEINFGKYKWLTFEAVAKENISYLERLYKSASQQEDKDIDLLHTIKHHLHK